MRFSWICLCIFEILFLESQRTLGFTVDTDDNVDDPILKREKRQGFVFPINTASHQPSFGGFTIGIPQSFGGSHSNSGFQIGFNPGNQHGGFHNHGAGQSNHNHAIGFGNNQEPSRGNSNKCRGNRRNRPECRGQGQGTSGQISGINCNDRKNRKALACGGRGLNCDKRKNRNHQECQGSSSGMTDQAGGSSSDPDVELNCAGKRKKEPGCRQAIENHKKCRGKKKFTKKCLGTGEVSQAFEEISWLNQLSAGDLKLVLPGLPGTPQASSAQTRFSLAAGQADVPFYSCVTPDFREPGHCRYLQHCILPSFIQNFNIFLKYVCFINGEYLGVCCPDSRYPEIPTTTTRRPTTTLRPPTPSSATGCGLNSKQQTRIVGGTRAEPNEFPWAAALLRNGETQYCGGVLISNRHVLSAAHCIDGFDQNTVKVRLGEYTFDEEGESLHKDFPLASMKMHENYDTTTYINDIALLTLARTTDFSKEIWPVCLPPPGDNFVGKTGTVIGWGTIYYGGPTSSVLQKVNLPVWTNVDCDNAYKDNAIFEENLCAGDRAGGRDSCQGDSGGPLLLQIGQRWATIGVVSWGIRCAEPGNPGVYARVNKYLDWIDRNTN